MFCKVVTFVLVVATDLLTGVLVGLAMSLLELVPYRRNLKLKVDESHDEHESHVALEGTATFLSLTKLTGALERLPAEYREVLALREFEECSYKEIASITQLKIGTVMSRLARARERLAAALVAEASP